MSAKNPNALDLARGLAELYVKREAINEEILKLETDLRKMTSDTPAKKPRSDKGANHKKPTQEAIYAFFEPGDVLHRDSVVEMAAKNSSTQHFTTPAVISALYRLAKRGLLEYDGKELYSRPGSLKKRS